MAPPPMPAPQPGFLWVRPRGGRGVLPPRTHQDRQGRSQRAASPHPDEPQLRKGLGRQIAPQPGLAALPHTAQAARNPRRPEDYHDCAWEGERDLAGRLREPCRRGPTLTPWGCRRRDLGLSASAVPDKPAPHAHACRHKYTCTHVGPGAHTRAHIYAQDPRVHLGACVLTYVSRRRHTRARRYCTLTCRCVQTFTDTCTSISCTYSSPNTHTLTHTSTYVHTPRRMLRSHTRLQGALTYTGTGTDLYRSDALERLDRGQQC